MSDNRIIPYGKQHITQEDIDAVVQTLTSDYLTQGPKIAEFERAFATYIGSTFAVAVANGTAALHLCALALGVNEQSKVITTPITFAASANCVRYCGGEVVFSDIDPTTYLLDIHAVRRMLEAAPKGTYQGIIPVDFSGRAIDLKAFRTLADEYGLWIIEDACHAPGGFFMDGAVQQRCGNGSYAELAIFSFHPVKHIASGEGGMITTNDEQLYKKLLMLRTHGITRETGLFQNSPSFASSEKNETTFPGWYMEMQELGFNYRLTDFQAALGLSQLRRADIGLARRRAIAEKYFNAFNGKSYITGESGVVEGHAYHLYIIEADDRLGLYQHLRSKNIFGQIHYIPTHLMPYYRRFGWKEGDMPNAERYYSRCLSLPMYPTLTDTEQDFVLDIITQYFKK
ncbi:MAG: UDP-4-amino-4,6-dideoxy-N-acetyl-beta-L-altrosamine transaminase [Bacteroidetes bacterium]|nr:UDP-4-amino-4,6-dideoxy-N-acetyl-beta-L-altrosamine transaminase [Bacteroidota bacterium]